MSDQIPQKIALTKSEFFGVMMLYAANIDGFIEEREIATIKRFIGVDAFQKSQNLFDSLNDHELITFFRDHKDEFIHNSSDETEFLKEVREVIMADEEEDIMENILLLAFRKLLDEE